MVPLLIGPFAPPEPLEHRDTRVFSVLSANLFFRNTEPVALIEQIDRLQPDLICLQECAPETRLFLTGELGSSYPYSLHDASHSWAGSGVVAFSRTPLLPFSGEPYRGVGGHRWLEFEVEVAGTRLRVANAHFYAPLSLRSVRQQDLMSAHAATWLSTSYGARPMLIAGDLNSNEHGLPVRRLLRSGFRSVHTERGRGIGATWPRTGVLRHLPGTRLDHVLYRGEGLRLIEQGVGEDFGSDHRPVWARFEVISDR